MGSSFWAHPAKRLDKEFREMGASRVERTRHSTVYRFPDGAHIMVARNIGPGAARTELGRVQGIYGHRVDTPLADAEPRSGAPTIDLTRMTASAHATERFNLMRRQAQLTYAEVLEALRIPERVLWSERHGTWLWVRDRIAVVAGVAPSGHATVTTILWAQQELWDNHPRPRVTPVAEGSTS